MSVLVVCIDLLKEAVARKWFLGLGFIVSLILLAIGLALQWDVVDGALTATYFFGRAMETDIRPADVALRPVFQVAAYIVFYGGILCGVFVTSGLGPSLLAPGRIELFLSLPITRPALLAGTFMGVLTLSLIGNLLGTIGLTIILGVKTGYWQWHLIFAGLLASASFAVLYTAMLTGAVFLRSVAFSTMIGVLFFILSIVAGSRTELSALFAPGVGRFLFELLTAPLPRITELAKFVTDLAVGQTIDGIGLLKLLLGQLLFGLAVFALGVWRFEKRDF